MSVQTFTLSETDPHPDTRYVLHADYQALAAKLAACEAELAKERAYIKKMDGIIEEVGGVTASCINPYEDLKRALIGQKARAERAEAALARVGACQRYGLDYDGEYRDDGGPYLLAADVRQAVRGEGDGNG